MTTPSSAAKTGSCSYGDAQAIFQAFYPFYLHQPSQFRVPLEFEGEEVLIPPCQYRIWLDGDHFTFSEDDWFFGGNAWSFEYLAAGSPRNDAIAFLERLDDRLWLAKIDTSGQLITPLVEQTLQETGYRDSVGSEFGAFVYRQVGIVLHLAPGDYLSVWESTFDGQPYSRAQVTLHIVPSG